MDALQPLRCALRSADAALLYMTRSLGFDWHEKMGWTFVRPSEGLWPDLEVRSRHLAPEHLSGYKDSGTAWLRYSPHDLQVNETFAVLTCEPQRLTTSTPVDAR